MKKLLTGLGAAVVLVLGVAAPALAHVSPSITEAPAGGFATFTLHVGHGCDDDSATNKLEVQMPEGIEEVTPQAIPGWESSVDDSDGLVVTFEGGPLPHDQYLDFGLSLQIPDTPGETLLFPTIQTCEGGASTSWIEETPEGGEEPEHPAPAIAVTEASDDGHSHGGAEGDEGDEDAAADGEGDGESADDHAEAIAAHEDEEGDSDTLATVALVVGALGLLTGGYAVLSARRAS